VTATHRRGIMVGLRLVGVQTAKTRSPWARRTFGVLQRPPRKAPWKSLMQQWAVTKRN